MDNANTVLDISDESVCHQVCGSNADVTKMEAARSTSLPAGSAAALFY
jgi:hypothetical protein